MIKYLLIALLVLGISCTKKSTPENTLGDFINYRFKSGQDMEDLVEMTASPLKERLETLEGEELKKFLDSSDLRKKKLRVLLKNCEAEKCFLTYVISYDQGKASPKDFGVEVKKIAQVIKEGESWKIAEINNLKTYIEGKKELDVSLEGEAESSK